MREEADRSTPAEELSENKTDVLVKSGKLWNLGNRMVLR